MRKFVPNESMQQYFTFESTVCFSDTRLVCFPVCLHKAQRYFHISIYPTAESRYTSAIDCSRKQNIFVFLRSTIIEDACPSCFIYVAFAELDISTSLWNIKLEKFDFYIKGGWFYLPLNNIYIRWSNQGLDRWIKSHINRIIKRILKLYFVTYT